MSDTPFNPVPRYRKPESAMDLLDPAQHFQGDLPSKKEQEEHLRRVEGEEKEKIKQEKLDAAKKALEKKRGLRKRAASRKGRRASIVTGALGTNKEPEIRRASLG